MSTKLNNSIIVKGSVSYIYNLWANFENFPQFMKNIKSVKRIDNRKSHWIMEGPFGKDIEWDAKITSMETNKRIAWKSLDGTIKTSGQVSFNELSHHETQVTIMMQYVAPAGKIGEVASHMIDDPNQKLAEDLKNFKTYAEALLTSEEFAEAEIL